MRDSFRRSEQHLHPNNQRYIEDCENGYRITESGAKCLNRTQDDDDEEVVGNSLRVRRYNQNENQCLNREKALSLTTFSVNRSSSIRELTRHNSTVSDRTLFTNSSNESPPLESRNYRVHHILREVLMIERTFSKELELICSWVRDFFESELHSNIRSDSFMVYLSLLEPLVDIHKSYLQDLEFKFSSSLSQQEDEEENISLEGSRFQSLVEPIISCLEVTFRSFCSLLYSHFAPLANQSIEHHHLNSCHFIPLLNSLFQQLYQGLIEVLPSVMENLNDCFKSNKNFERSCHEFEVERGCYLPFATCLVKPSFHVRTLNQLFDRKSYARKKGREKRKPN